MPRDPKSLIGRHRSVKLVIVVGINSRCWVGEEALGEDSADTSRAMRPASRSQYVPAIHLSSNASDGIQAAEWWPPIG